ncbi:MAG: alginate lyase family protein [Aggregatilineales bacterium]
MFRPQHYGLYFTEAHVQQAREQQARPPLAAAWARLRGSQPLERLALALRLGLRWRCDGDAAAGQRAAALLAEGLLPTGASCDDLAAATAAVQCFELARSHPDTTPRPWLEGLRAYLADVERQPPASYVEALWRITLGIAAAVALEDEARFAAAAEAFRAVVAHDIHPEGYLPKVVEAKAGHTLEGMLRAAQALVLAAEAAAHAGQDLWACAVRGVSVMTPIPYLLYYYYYPDRWRWGAPVSVDQGQALYRAHAGFWEMARRRSSLRDLGPFLDELRPVDDPLGGGLTTLTHGADAPRQRRGLFR